MATNTKPTRRRPLRKPVNAATFTSRGTASRKRATDAVSRAVANPCNALDEIVRVVVGDYRAMSPEAQKQIREVGAVLATGLVVGLAISALLGGRERAEQSNSDSEGDER